MTDPLETTFSVNGYQLAALEWNPGAPNKIIALHGWLDNAASFVRLAPLLEHCHVLALDLAGHGLSDHKPPQGTYNVWDDLVDIVAIANHQGWQRFQLLGHSRGAIVGLLLAAALPQRVQSLVMLDGLLPKPVLPCDSVKQLGQFIEDYLKPRDRARAGYDSFDKAVQVRCKATGMSEESARPIVARSVVEVDGRYHWRSDSRLTNASAFKLSAEHNQAFIDALLTPHLLLITREGVASYNYFQSLFETNDKLNYEVMEGSHHFHLELPAHEIGRRIALFHQQLAKGDV